VAAGAAAPGPQGLLTAECAQDRKLGFGEVTLSTTFDVTIERASLNGIDREGEALKARRRLYPVTILYSAYAIVILALALARDTRWVSLGFFALGVALWTGLEYWVHRFILHGRFPDGPGLYEHVLHKYFDHLHLEHHKRPWDGNHISGTTRDTLPFVAVFVALSYLAPFHTLPVLVAGIMQAYIVEEWVHHSVHFCSFKGLYFQYIKRHHLYHHSPKGTHVGFGLTSGTWDMICDTRIPEADRRGLYARLRP
jgi:sterol desaturase/sphingolipid hydroxylase (fatty acid hydroxylase superfamily)